LGARSTAVKVLQIQMQGKSKKVLAVT